MAGSIRENAFGLTIANIVDAAWKATPSNFLGAIAQKLTGTAEGEATRVRARNEADLEELVRANPEAAKAAIEHIRAH